MGAHLAFLSALLAIGSSLPGSAGQQPNPRVAVLPQPRITVDVTPNPAHVDSEVIFTAIVTPPVEGLVYRFRLDGQLLPGEWQDSPQYTYVPRMVGGHTVAAEVGRRFRRPTGRATLEVGIESLELPSSRTPFAVQPPIEPPPPPPPTPTPPVALTLTLTSPNVVVGEPASFAVSIAGAETLVPYVLDPGDGSGIQTRSDAEFTHVYRNAGEFIAAVSLPPETGGTGSSVTVNVEAPPPPLLALTLSLTSSTVVAGEPATFAVSVEGGGPLPEYVIDLGDGSVRQIRRDAEFTYVYQNAGVFTASVAFPAGIPGRGATALVAVRSAPTPAWPIGVALVLAIVGAALVVGKLLKKPDADAARDLPDVLPDLHPEPDFEPRFDPARPAGISVSVHLVPNLADVQFTPPVRISRER